MQRSDRRILTKIERIKDRFIEDLRMDRALLEKHRSLETQDLRRSRVRDRAEDPPRLLVSRIRQRNGKGKRKEEERGRKLKKKSDLALKFR